MNEENANTLNQNAAPAPVEATPVLAPVETAPVQPVPAPVEAAPAPTAPVASVQPVQPVQPVAPVAPVAQPVATAVPVYAPQEPPKKKSNLPFIIIVVVLLLAIVGLVVAFILNNTKKDDTKEEETKTEEKKKEEEKPKEEEKKEEEKPVASSNSFEYQGITFTLPSNYKYALEGDEVIIYQEGVSNIYLNIFFDFSYDDLASANAELKQQLVDGGIANVIETEKNIGTSKWHIFQGDAGGITFTSSYTDFHGGCALVITKTKAGTSIDALYTDINTILDSAQVSTSFGKKDDTSKEKIELPELKMGELR